MPSPSQQIAQLQQQVAELKSDQARTKKLNKAIHNLGIIQTSLEERATHWMNAARMVGSAYKIADNMYNKALEEQKTSDTLGVQLFFSLMTIAVTGGLGWIGAAAISAAESEAASALRTLHGFNWSEPKKVDTVILEVRDVALQAMAGEISSMGPLGWPATSDSPVSQDPQKFQNDLEKKVDHLKGQVLKALNKLSDKYTNELPLSAWDTYDPEADLVRLRKWQKKAQEFYGDDELPGEAWMARELERGRWAQYILNNHSHLDFGIFETEESPDDVGNFVRDRLKNLGVTAAVSPELHGKQAGMAITYAVRKQLWDWAKKYEVRKFTDEKKLKGGGGPDHQ
jgi:hypothetical protein